MYDIIAVISGKGGVGKSTVATNLAISLAHLKKEGSSEHNKVALIDCDFYGPSIPTLMGNAKVGINENKKLVPPEKHGVKFISIGFFLEHPDDPVIWRGPMFQKAMMQMFEDVEWGEVDYCIVDMPPGTGDAALSLAQNFPLAGAIVVTTPQEVALSDVRKAINMLSKVEVPLIGIVENMSGFAAEDGKVYHIFGEGGGKRLAELYGCPLLASIPLEPSIREGGDTAKPCSAMESGPGRAIFDDLALKVAEQVVKVRPRSSRLTVVN
ncbi:MAG: ATP-binding protein [Candidatus Dadabacteria bacterium]|nr:MAG: ATP-binding protein [Candidatus Dadabacteria bacterium]